PSTEIDIIRTSFLISFSGALVGLMMLQASWIVAAAPAPAAWPCRCSCPCRLALPLQLPLPIGPAAAAAPAAAGPAGCPLENRGGHAAGFDRAGPRDSIALGR